MIRRLAACVVFSLLCAMPAHADRIDGDWCSAEGKTLSIDGPTIRIPSGATITGQYERHAFRYLGPEGDPEFGQEVLMRIFSDDDMLLVRLRDGQPGPEEQWRRCKPIA